MAKVAIVMGSDSDLPVMSKAADFLEEMGIDYEMTIISAHREPDIFFEWAKGAEERGVKVIIAGAGKAAHLPGMCAALFPMPVIGIPMKTSDLGGVDSLYSIVQMPSGIPVATVAINGGQNAGILAAKIIGFATCPFISFMLSYFILICLKVAFFGFDICSAFLIILPYPNAASHFVKIPNKKILPITYRKYFSLIIFGALL